MNLPSIIHLLFTTYTILLVIRILTSWAPDLQRYEWCRFLRFYTDPYLNLFRKIIPPIGGVLDLSPILAFIALRVVESFILGLFR